MGQDIHGVSDQGTLAQVLLTDELCHVVCHDGVVVFRVMEGVSMVSEVLLSVIIKEISTLSILECMGVWTNHYIHPAFEVTCQSPASC
jgi:hypothetical protein